MAPHLLAGAQYPWGQYVEDLCRRMPPGYRDVDRPLADLSSTLVRQLRVLGPDNALSDLRGNWLGSADSLAKPRHCPEHWIEETAGLSSSTQFTLKMGGASWRVHKSDADPWPSTPHAHRLGGREKVDLVTGQLWYYRKRSGGRVAHDVLTALQAEVAVRWPDVTITSMCSSEIRRPAPPG